MRSHNLLELNRIKFSSGHSNLESRSVHGTEVCIAGNPSYSARVYHVVVYGTIHCYKGIFCTLFNSQKLISQRDHLSFCKKAASFECDHSVTSKFSNGVFNTTVFIMSTMPFSRWRCIRCFVASNFFGKALSGAYFWSDWFQVLEV